MDNHNQKPKKETKQTKETAQSIRGKKQNGQSKAYPFDETKSLEILQFREMGFVCGSSLYFNSMNCSVNEMKMKMKKRVL